jgi:hypothetical protein
MQVKNKHQHDNATRKEDHRKATTQIPEKTIEVNIESNTNPGTKNTQSIVFTTISAIDTTPSLPSKIE